MQRRLRDRCADLGSNSLTRREFSRIAVTAALAGTSVGSCASDKTEIRVFHAGSLARLVDVFKRRFERDNPRARVLPETSGSLDAIRKVTDLRRSADLVMVADALLLEELLIPQYADNYHSFLGNEMVLATSQTDLFSAPTEWHLNWYEQLFSRRLSYGASDPDRDPAGYYVRLLWKLAEIHYDRPGLNSRLTSNFSDRWMRPKSSELVAMLETGQLDVAFLYQSTAIQNNLKFIRFPPEISLGDAAYGEFYGQSFLSVAGRTQKSRIEVRGRPIRAGACLLRDARPEAAGFLDLFIRPESSDVFREMGFAVTPHREVRP